MATLTGARRIGVPNMKLIRLKGWPILQQLHLEESLFRTSSDNICIFNDGTNVPSIVMGASGKLAELVEIKPVLRDQVPVIKRFSGGGTVIVDKDTVFVTFICNKDAIPGLQPYPRPIMSWSSQIYDHVFDKACNFQLRENDYVFGNHKFGGNAQSITKRRWIHHTSFLWDYEIENMAYLKLPTRAPEYRLARSHTEFICRMKDYLARSEFIDKTISALGSHFSMEHVELEPSQQSLAADFVPSSREITIQEMEEALAELASEIVGTLLGEPHSNSGPSSSSCNARGDPPVVSDCWFNCTLEDISGEDKQQRLRKDRTSVVYLI
ncbi:hypothetical protein MLD38_025012 [Melastoma candidum]|uniref:Uncharacterized protein n=1 Tax=Melastoma candidum TaxID=119954 RepID=A0ACB9NV08_9MYRT|nr:hypothetical protein MLD38_025012 [Melastoma candidum]